MDISANTEYSGAKAMLCERVFDGKRELGRSAGPNLRVLFFVKGFTDIRFVVGLSHICELTIAVPERTYVESGLKQRIVMSGAQVRVDEIPGNRLAFQVRSF